ncbi:MAG TPA: cysteine synthase A [bacterium]|jgi:cysteine synthase A|nr:cysteine synthase A [bacterium]
MARKRAESVLDLIGRTPLVRLKSFEKAGGARLWAKVEMANPGGSVKDRIALGMLKEAERKGRLKPGAGTVVEPTSGNTGVGLALVAAVKGWRCVLVMPEGLPERRIALLKAYGAEIELTPFELGMSGAIERAEALLKANPSWFMPMQFSNRENPAMHRTTTGPEIYKALDGQVHAFVAAVGTGGTLTGVAEFLRRKSKSVKVVAVEPSASPVLSGGQPGAHRILGIGAGFVPPVLNLKLVDRIMTVADAEAAATASALARREGLLAGLSSGANVFAAAQVAAAEKPGRNVVTVLCDRGELYVDERGAIE